MHTILHILYIYLGMKKCTLFFISCTEHMRHASNISFVVDVSALCNYITPLKNIFIA